MTAIDVPVKHYSSGMDVRLAFPIAIHVRPDISPVDKTPAVGEQAVQLRCLDKANEMKRRGVTIILVTHDLDTTRRLCDQAIRLREARVEDQGEEENVIEQYEAQVFTADEQALQQAEPTCREQEIEATPASDTMVEVTSSEEVEKIWRWESREAEIERIQWPPLHDLHVARRPRLADQGTVWRFLHPLSLGIVRSIHIEGR